MKIICKIVLISILLIISWHKFVFTHLVSRVPQRPVCTEEHRVQKQHSFWTKPGSGLHLQLGSRSELQTSAHLPHQRRDVCLVALWLLEQMREPSCVPGPLETSLHRSAHRLRRVSKQTAEETQLLGQAEVTQFLGQTPISGSILIDWLYKQDPTFCCL